MCKKVSLFMLSLLLLLTTTVFASIPNGLVDSSPDKAILVNYPEWYFNHAAPDTPKMVSETVYSSPRSIVMLRDAGKGLVVDGHYHATCDEIVIIMGGSGEMVINGEWKSVKAGDVHVNPRGNIHNTRVGNSEDLQFISIFTPPQPVGGDANMVKDGEKISLAKGLLASTPDKAILVNYDEWYTHHQAPNDSKIVSETIFSSPRSIVMLRDAGRGTIIPSHFHATADEIVVVIGGSGEMLVNGQWVPLKAGDVHVNPRGTIHATRVLGNEDLKFISIFAPPQPVGGDVNILQ